ncbi:protein-glutamate methylesterase/protein-glutamine glutaminase [Magnetococcales bacterium HHB-1]
MSVRKKTRVLVVDDSAIVRQTLTKILSTDPQIEVIGSAPDPFVAAEKIKNLVPDVITLDIEMPRMDGLTFLRKIMTQHPIPVVMCSTLTGEGSEMALKAMEYGAIEIITKPKVGAKSFLEESRISICDVVKAAAMSNLKKLQLHSKPKTLRRPVSSATGSTSTRASKAAGNKGGVAPKLTADAMLAKPITSRSMAKTTEKIVVVGASTGGTEALREFLMALPPDSPGIVIVQHMPDKFTNAFANRLNGLCQISVKEAENNDSILRGQALIAPGSMHAMVKRSGARYYVEVKDGPLVSRHRPSVDVLFRSAAAYGGANVVGVIMTGMGDDGARGMKEMKDAGAVNIAQDEASCVVFGMPKEAIKHGGVDIVKPLNQIAAEMLRLCG